MRRYTDVLSLCLAVVLGLWVTGVGLLGWQPWALGEEGSADKAAPRETPDKPAAGDDKTDEEESGGGVDFFPGVRGISGKELEQAIKEHERRKEEEERRRRRHAENRSTGKPDEKPAAGDEKKADPAKPDPKPEVKPVAKPTGPDLKAAELSDDARAYFKAMKTWTLRAELLLEKAAAIRTDAETDAGDVGNEELIQYILQYTKRSTKDTRAYQGFIKFPLLIFRYVYEQATAGLKYDRTNRPADLPKEGVEAADDYVKRLKAARRAALLASAELYTKVRQLSAAETIYAAILERWPDDAEIKKSHEAFVAVRDAPKPDQPPGTSAGDGKSENYYDRGDRDDDDGEEGESAADQAIRRYSR